jgi:Fe-S cluster biogenesis protein NfuA
MLDRVTEVIEDIGPLIQSVGSEATVVGVDDGVATIRLAAQGRFAQHDPKRLEAFIERELREEISDLTDVRFETAAPPGAVEISVIQPDDTAHTCIFTLDKVLNADGSALFENAAEAAGWPLVQAVFGAASVDSIMVKDRMLIINRVDEDPQPWGDLIAGVKATIEAHFLKGKPVGQTGPVDEESIRRRVEELLEAEVNPAVSAHGGNITLTKVEGTVITVLMGGGCQGCGMAAVTLRQGVERAIFEAVPEVTEILDATEHDQGHNPYYT